MILVNEKGLEQLSLEIKRKNAETLSGRQKC